MNFSLTTATWGKKKSHHFKKKVFSYHNKKKGSPFTLALPQKLWRSIVNTRGTGYWNCIFMLLNGYHSAYTVIRGFNTLPHWIKAGIKPM